MQQTLRPLVGIRHYHVPRIEYQIPPLPDYIRHWGGKTPAFNLVGHPTSLSGAFTVFLRRRGVARLVLSSRQQSLAIAFFLLAGISWKVYPLAFFLLTALVGGFSVCYRNLCACTRENPVWKAYRQVSFYSVLLFLGMAIMTMVYLRISF